MTERAFATVALAIACAVFVSGQSPLAGTWEGETAQGRLVSLVLAVKGETLTGTITIDRQPVTISDGKVTGTTFSFKGSLDGNTRSFTGELVKDEIRLTPDGGRAPAILRRPAFKPPSTGVK